MSGALNMNSNKVTGLAAASANGDALRYEQLIGVYLPLAGGTMDSEAGINMNMGYLSEIGSLKGGVGWDFIFYGSNAGGTGLNEMMRWDASEQDIKIASGVNFNMNGGDITNADEIKGTTGNSLELDFRGDGNQKIYYDSANTRIAYKAAVEHAFAVGAAITTTISANGILMNSGKYIKSLTGDLELRAPSGSKIKFVIG